MCRMVVNQMNQSQHCNTARIGTRIIGLVLEFIQDHQEPSKVICTGAIFSTYNYHGMVHVH